MISVLVVQSNQNKTYKRNIPGSGFYKLWRNHYSDSKINDIQIFDREMQKVITCSDWWRLENSLDLNTKQFKKDYVPLSKTSTSDIGNNYNFKDYDSDFRDISLSKEQRAIRTQRHQELLYLLATKLEDSGHHLYKGIMDCLAIKDFKRNLLIEVKTLDDDLSDELYQIRHALAQLLYYEEFHLYQVPSGDLYKIALFERKIKNEYISFLEKHHCLVLWKTKTENIDGTDDALKIINT